MADVTKLAPIPSFYSPQARGAMAYLVHSVMAADEAMKRDDAPHRVMEYANDIKRGYERLLEDIQLTMVDETTKHIARKLVGSQT